VNSGKIAAWVILLLLPAGFMGVWRLQRHINAERDTMHQEQDEVLVRSPKLMRLLTSEYSTLAADIYWTRAVQYYGNKRLGQDANLDSLWPLLDLSTTLIPVCCRPIVSARRSSANLNRAARGALILR